MEKKDLDLEAAEPLISYSAKRYVERKPMSKISATRTELQNDLTMKFKKMLEEKEPKYQKIKSKFLSKVYLHILGQALFLIIMIFLAFKIKIFHNFLKQKNITLYIALISLLVTFIYPLISDQVLKSFPINYLYLLLFSLIIGYFLCRIAINFDFSLIEIISLLNILELLYLLIESLIQKNNEKTETDMANTATFMGLFILFVGSILCVIKQIKITKLLIIILILVFLGIYIIYYMNCILIDKRRTIKNDEFVLATMFLYIDIFQTFLDLLEKFYNSCEPERRPIKKQSHKKSMIFTGEEDYQLRYRKEEDEKNSYEDEYADLKRHKKRKSSTDLKRRIDIDNKDSIIEELDDDENASDKEGNNKSIKDSDDILIKDKDEKKE